MAAELIFSRRILWLFFLVPFSAFSGKPNHSPTQHLLFVENKKQWDDRVLYRADLKGGLLFLESNRLTYVFYHQDDVAALHPGHGTTPSAIRLHAFRMTLAGSQTPAGINGADTAAWRNNYFLGSDTNRWATDVNQFREIHYDNLYPGIGMKVYSDRANPKIDFLVDAGADANDIVLQYEGVDRMEIDEGKLRLFTSVGEIVEQAPVAWQWIDGKKTEVPCSFRLTGNTVRFFFPEGYRKSFPLVIDPTLIFSSFTGSTADNWGFTATYDHAGNSYGGGNVNSIGYPVNTGAYQLTYGGGGTGGSGWSCDMAIAKFNTDGSSLLYATYLGGSDNEQPQSLVVDNNNNLFIFGTCYSGNFPVTTSGYQQAKNGSGDMVVCKLSPGGNSLLASTYIGGSNEDGINTSAIFTTGGPIKYNYGDDARGEILIDPAGNILVASCTRSTNFPTTAGAFQPAFAGGNQDGVLFKMNSSLSSLLWSSYLGGNGMDAAYSCVFDASGNIFVTGGTASSNFPTTAGVLHPVFQGGTTDGYISHISGNGSLLLHSTFIGTGDYDQTFFVQLDHAGDVYTTGQTEGNYPVTAGVYSNPNSSQFIHKLSADLSTTDFSTVFGSGSSTPNISPTAFLVDTCGNIYVSGWGRCNLASGYTLSSVNGMPITADAMQSTTDGCDFYFIVLSRDAAALQYGTFYGGSLSQEHVDGGTSRFDENGMIYQSVCAGCGGNSDFPTTPGVVSNSNNSGNCNNAVMKVQFNFSRTRALAAGTPVSGCAPLVVQFSNNSVNGVTYAWDFDDGTPGSTAFQPTHTFTTSGVHQVMLISRNPLSCNLADTTYIDVTVTPAPPVVVTMNLVPAPGCDSLVLQVVFTGSGGNSYAWSFGDGALATGTSAQHTYASPGTYTITLVARDTVCLAADTATESVTLRGILEATIQPSTLFGCAPQDLTLSSAYSGTGLLQWDFGDGTGSTGNPVQHLFSSPGNFPVRLVIFDTSACNPLDTAWFNLAVFASPRAGFTIESMTEYWPGHEITFTDTSLFASQLLWTFSDLFSSTDSVVRHSFRRGGPYQVCLEATSDEGCRDIACRTLEIIEAEGIYVPNSFTPNRDGHNDTFYPVTVGILDLHMRIFNRWGQVVAEWNGLSGSWDGTFHGSPAKKDVYIYEIHAVGSITPTIVKSGRVTLVR